MRERGLQARNGKVLVIFAKKFRQVVVEKFC